MDWLADERMVHKMDGATDGGQNDDGWRTDKDDGQSTQTYIQGLIETIGLWLDHWNYLA